MNQLVPSPAEVFDEERQFLKALDDFRTRVLNHDLAMGAQWFPAESPDNILGVVRADSKYGTRIAEAWRTHGWFAEYGDFYPASGILLAKNDCPALMDVRKRVRGVN